MKALDNNSKPQKDTSRAKPSQFIHATDSRNYFSEEMGRF